MSGSKYIPFERHGPRVCWVALWNTCRGLAEGSWWFAGFGSAPTLVTSACRSKAKNAQEAHEAVRPTRPALLPPQLAARLAPRSPLARLYELVWRRTAASQMADARVMQVRSTRRCWLLGGKG